MLLYHPAMVEVFVERGNQLADSRRLMDNDPQYASALALVSIHCAIALNDAFLSKVTGRHHRGEDHMESVRVTRKQCSSRRIPSDGVKHLEDLVRAKTRVSYSGERTTIEVAMRLAIASERFERWVRPLIKT